MRRSSRAGARFVVAAVLLSSIAKCRRKPPRALYRLCWAVAAALVIGGIIADRYEHAHGLIILVFAAMAWLASVAARVCRYVSPSEFEVMGQSTSGLSVDASGRPHVILIPQLYPPRHSRARFCS